MTVHHRSREHAQALTESLLKAQTAHLLGDPNWQHDGDDALCWATARLTERIARELGEDAKRES
jgi:hypothetical protein